MGENAIFAKVLSTKQRKLVYTLITDGEIVAKCSLTVTFDFIRLCSKSSRVGYHVMQAYLGSVVCSPTWN